MSGGPRDTCLLHYDKTHGHKTGLPSPWPEDYKWWFFILFWDIFNITHEVSGAVLERKEIISTLRASPNDSSFFIMIYDIHLLKFYYFCNLIQFFLFYHCSGQHYLICLSHPCLSHLDKDISSFIMSMMTFRLKQPTQYNCFHWCQPSLSPLLLLQHFYEDTYWQWFMKHFLWIIKFQSSSST